MYTLVWTRRHASVWCQTAYIKRAFSVRIASLPGITGCSVVYPSPMEDTVVWVAVVEPESEVKVLYPEHMAQQATWFDESAQ